MPLFFLYLYVVLFLLLFLHRSVVRRCVIDENALLWLYCYLFEYCLVKQRLWFCHTNLAGVKCGISESVEVIFLSQDVLDLLIVGQKIHFDHFILLILLLLDIAILPLHSAHLGKGIFLTSICP